MVQILLSSVCTINASAAEETLLAPASAHCQKDGVAMGASAHVLDAADMDHTTCSHCDEPEVSLSTHVTFAPDMVPVLLAVIALPEVGSTVSPHVMVGANAPLHSFSLLYQTTRRILI